MLACWSHTWKEFSYLFIYHIDRSSCIKILTWYKKEQSETASNNVQPYDLQSPRLSLSQETRHLRVLVHLFFCARGHYYYYYYYYFVFFNFILPVIYWCSYKGLFRIFFPNFYNAEIFHGSKLIRQSHS